MPGLEKSLGSTINFGNRCNLGRKGPNGNCKPIASLKPAVGGRADLGLGRSAGHAGGTNSSIARDETFCSKGRR